MKIAYFDNTCGASGDMLLAAVLDVLGQMSGVWSSNESIDMLGSWSRQIDGLLKCEPGGNFKLRRLKRGKTDALKIDFFVEHTHADDHRGRFRNFPEITRLLMTERECGRLSSSAYELATKVFGVLLQAEAVAHNTSPEEVHFHEVGAFDSIMDIASFAAAFSLLEVERVHCSSVTVGSGTVNTAHGVLSVPPPAVSEIIRKYEIPLTGLDLPGECLTPTGAAILASVTNRWGPVPDFERLLFTGCGAGTREVPGSDNMVRLIVGSVVKRQALIGECPGA